MTFKTLRLSALFSALLLLVACQATPLPQLGGTQPLISDSDIDAAIEAAALEPDEFSFLQILELPDIDLSRLVTADGSSLTDLEAAALEAETVLESETADLETLSSHGFDRYGHIAFIRRIEGASSPWNIFIADQGVITDPNTGARQTLHVYGGSRQIQSVAVSGNGRRVLFTMRERAGETSDSLHQAFLLTYTIDPTTGRAVPTITQLTRTAFDKLNVSMSADGQILAWEGTGPVSGLKGVYIRDYRTPADGRDYTLSYVGVTDANLESPAISANGLYVAVVRNFTTMNVRAIAIYDRQANFFTTLRSVTNRTLSWASVSDEGNKAAWMERLVSPSGTFSIVYTGTVTTPGATPTTEIIFNEALPNIIYRPFMTADGRYLSYGMSTPTLSYIFLRDLLVRDSFGRTLIERERGSLVSVLTLNPYWQLTPTEGLRLAADLSANPVAIAEPVDGQLIETTHSLVSNVTGLFVWGATLELRIINTVAGDLIVKLRHEESGREIELVSNPINLRSDIRGTFGDCGGRNIIAIVDDAGTASLQNDCNVTFGRDAYLPFLRYRPNQALSNLINLPAGGTWTLVMTDTYPQNSGARLEGWALNLRVADSARPGFPLP